MPTLQWLTRDHDLSAADTAPYRLLEEVTDLGAPVRPELKKPPLDVEAWFARLDELGGRDFLPDGVPDDPPAKPDPRKFFDE